MQQTEVAGRINVENVVACANVGRTLDLEEFAWLTEDVEYHPTKFPGLVLKLDSPKSVTLIFKSGKLVCTGARSTELAKKALKRVFQMLRSGGIELMKEPIIEIHNIVASGSLGCKVLLEETARQLPKSMYEPDQFSGLIHRTSNPKSVILVFASGKLVCTGRKILEDIYRAVSNLRSTLDDKRLLVCK